MPFVNRMNRSLSDVIALNAAIRACEKGSEDADGCHTLSESEIFPNVFNVSQAIDMSLDRLGLTSVDALIIHHPDELEDKYSLFTGAARNLLISMRLTDSDSD